MAQPLRAETDVAVVGGGPIGVAYAGFLRERLPDASVTVLEHRPEPGYKIGESALGTTTRWVRHMGLPLPILRRLFGIKAGIRFWWTGEGDVELHRHVEAVDIDETFQFERRVLETALLECARRQGIDVRTGTRVDVAASDLGADGVRLRCEPADGEPYDVAAALVCDASGQASVLPRHLGVYRRDPARAGTFNTNAYYAYYRQREDVPVEHWDEPATRHVCFPQGWCWFITVHSWEGTPQDRLEALVRALLDHPPGPDESYPTRRELEERFGATTEVLLSVGFTVREDRDTALGLPEEERFGHYLERYPAIASILERYELVERPYGKPGPFGALLGLTHDATAVAGDRWCAVGDSAMFTNPLFSPGLNLGTGTAYEAARATAAALTDGDLSAAAFAGYQDYAARLYRSLASLNDMLYRAFAHPHSFERALALFLYHGAADVLEREDYSETDPYVWDLLEPELVRVMDDVRGVLRSAEEQGRDLDAAAAEVDAVAGGYVARILARPEVAALDLGPVLREFGPDGRRAPHRETRPGPFTAVRCATCRLWFDGTLSRCPVCGTAQAG